MNVPSSSNNHPAHILLVDDNKMGLAARKAVLEELGYVITTAGTGHEALKRYAETDFELLITDYKMPRMSGVLLIEKIRTDSPTIPIILLSGFADALGLDAKNTGADIVIQKSSNEVSHMIRAVRKLLRRKKAAKKKPPTSQAASSSTRRKSG
jgi:CheY-like chemotaxis protein